MSYYLYNFEEEIDFDKIIIGDKIKLENDTFRYYIYYLDDTPKDFYIKLPPIKLIYSYKNNKYNQIKIPLYPIYDKITKFISFFKKFKKKIKENIIINKNYSESIEKKDNLKLLKININNDFKVNYKNEKLSIQELKVTSEICGIINISYIWENENSYGLSLYITKMIYTPKIYDDNVDFIDIIKYNNEIIKDDDKKNIKNEIIIQNPKLTISPSLLLEMKGKLNRVE